MTPDEIRDRTLHRHKQLAGRAKVLLAQAEALADRAEHDPAFLPALDAAVQAASTAVAEAGQETDYFEFLHERESHH